MFVTYSHNQTNSSNPQWVKNETSKKLKCLKQRRYPTKSNGATENVFKNTAQLN